MQPALVQLPPWLQIALAIVPTVSALFAAFGLWLNVQQARRTAKQARAALAASFLGDFADDEEMSNVFYEIEYSRFKYNSEFHESPQERQLDKLLVHFSNLSLAWQAGLLRDEDIRPVQYYVRLLLRDKGVSDYLKFVDNWSDHAKLGDHPYLTLRKMGEALGA